MAPTASDTAAAGTRRYAVLVASVVALVFGVLGWVVGAASGMDLEGPREQGTQRGVSRGLDVGSREGRAVGERQGRRAGFGGAYARGYVEAYRRGALGVEVAAGRRAIGEAFSKCGRDLVPVGLAETCGPR